MKSKEKKPYIIIHKRKGELESVSKLLSEQKYTELETLVLKDRTLLIEKGE